VTSHTNNTRDEVAVLKSQTGDLDKTYENKNEEIIHKKQQITEEQMTSPKRPLSATSTTSSLSEAFNLDISSKDESLHLNFDFSSNILNLPNWSVDDVENWMKGNNLEQFVSKTQQLQIDGDKLLSLNFNFKEFGNKATRTILKRKLKELRSLYEKKRKQIKKQNKKQQSNRQSHRKSLLF